MKAMFLVFSILVVSTALVAGVSRADSAAPRAVNAFANCVSEQRYAGETQERAEANCSTPDPSKVRPTMSRAATEFETCVSSSLLEGDAPEVAETGCL